MNMQSSTHNYFIRWGEKGNRKVKARVNLWDVSCQPSKGRKEEREGREGREGKKKCSISVDLQIKPCSLHTQLVCAHGSRSEEKSFEPPGERRMLTSPPFPPPYARIFLCVLFCDLDTWEMIFLEREIRLFAEGSREES